MKSPSKWMLALGLSAMLLVLGAAAVWRSALDKEMPERSSSPRAEPAECVDSYKIHRRYVVDVVKRAGFQRFFDNDAAIYVRDPQSGFAIWATCAPFDSEGALDAEGYEPYISHKRTNLYSDGTRVVWVRDGLYVWVEFDGPSGIAEGTTGQRAQRRVLKQLLRANGAAALFIGNPAIVSVRGQA